MGLKEFFTKILDFFRSEEETEYKETPKLEDTSRESGIDEEHISKLKPKIVIEKRKRRRKPETCEFEGCTNTLYIVRSFNCKFCEKWHCEEHRLPEKHDCKGSPKAPPGSYRGVYSKGEWIVTGK